MDEQLFKKVDIKVQKKSGFDKSHFNILTTKCGTLTPILSDEVIPNTTVDLKIDLSATLPPLASDTFMRCDLKAEAFFVPYRLCYGGYESWLTGTEIPLNNGTDTKGKVTMPVLQFAQSATTSAGTLADYLGYRAVTGTSMSGAKVNILPFVAYHRIYDDWYRNSLVQKPVFLKVFPNSSSLGANNSGKWNCSVLPYYAYTDYNNSTYNIITSNSAYSTLGDGVDITALRQRNFGMDYFTTATPQPQNGDAQKVSFNIEGMVGQADEVTGSGNFTIAALRAANSMQLFLERNNLAGNRMVDFVKAHYGANLNDGVAQRSLLLGSASFNVYSKGIYQTANNEVNANEQVVNVTNNPFAGSVGAEFGKAYGSGSDFIIKGFTAAEPGIIMVLVSLVPRVTYSTGIRRYLTRYIGTPANPNGRNGQVDLANPLLQNTGNQPIYARELNGKIGDANVFGYTDRYADWKTMDDELHGLLRDGNSLQSFALQRTFTDTGLTINSNFLAIPTNYMDQVAAVQQSISNYGVWIDAYCDYKVSMPLARYAIPSLQDPAYEHGEDISIQRAGTHL